MSQSQEKDSSAVVLDNSLRLGARVRADKLARSVAKPVLDARAGLKTAVRAREDQEDAAVVAEQDLGAREDETNRAVRAFGQKVAGHYASGDLPGDQSPVYLRVFADSPADKVLPPTETGRVEAIDGLTRRVNSPETPAEVKKDAKEVLSAIVDETAARTVRDQAVVKVTQAKDAEQTAKVACVVAERTCGAEVHKLFAKDPARVRAILGHVEAPHRHPKTEPPAPLTKGQKEKGSDATAKSPAEKPPPEEEKKEKNPAAPQTAGSATTPVIANTATSTPTVATATAGPASAPIIVTLSTGAPPAPGKS